MKRRKTRKVRRRRRTEMPGMPGTLLEMIVIPTTRVSNQFQGSLTNSVNSVANMLTMSSIVKMYPNIVSAVSWI